jgi:hypothetical protein
MEITPSGQYAIKVRVGNAEIEVSAPDKNFVLDESNRLIEQLNLASGVSHAEQQAASPNGAVPYIAVPEARTAKPETLAEFFKRFTNLQTNLDKMLIMGYWCEKVQGRPHFTAEDIKARYGEIKEKPPTRIGRDLDIIVTKGFLLPPKKTDEGSTYELSSSGIKEVEAKMS